MLENRNQWEFSKAIGPIGLWENSDLGSGELG